MVYGVQKLFDAALALSDGEQLQLLAALASAVEERGLHLQDETLLTEIRRRSAMYDVGEVTPVSWAEVKAHASVPSGANRELRPFGLAKGEFDVPEDFDAPLPDDVLETFEG